MKKIFILFAIFSLQIAPTFADENASNSATGTITVSGTIMIPTIDGQGTEPAISATVLIDGTTTGATADLDGNFTLPNVPANTSLKIEYVGCTDKILPAKNNMGTITLDCGEQLDEVVVVACAGDKANGIRKKENIEGECYPTECVTPRWELSGTGKNAKCVEQKCQFENGTGEWVADGDNWICQLKSCDTAKGYKKNDDSTTCIPMLKNCTDNQKSEHPNAKSTGIKEGTEECVATECKCGFNLTDGKCVAWPTDGVACNDTQNPKLPSNATAGTKQCDGKSAYCAVTACADGFKISDDKKSCISTRGDSCDATSVDKNATAGTNQNVNGKITCVITACGRGFKPNKNGTKCIAAELSEQDSLAKIDKLKDNAQKMRDKEQSTENKLLGAAGIGATGIGAMQMLSASAEQSADQDAEAAMRAYLATFHCNYGMGKNIAGGEKQVELPGGNELIGLYAEYVNLANDLKIRKNALGMRAGIESEPILDSATSGLYDDIAIGKTSGAYTSLARAIMDPTGADAIAWATQKSDSADKLKTGAITAGIGALGSLAGNLAINSGDAKKNKVNDIIAEFDKKKKIFQDLESDIKKIPPQVEKCPTGTTGTTPNCDCTGNNVYDSNRNICNPCNAPKIIENIDGVKVCKCPETHIESGDTCTPKPSGCKLTGLVKSDICECIDNANADSDNICKCKNGFEENPTRTCTAKKAPEEKKEEKKEEAKTISIDMPADSLFLIGKAELSTDAKNALANFRKNMEDAKLTNCKITVTGHTDRTGKTALNQKLSEKRAQAVWDELKDSTAFNKTTSVVEGKGLAECTCGTGLIPPGKENDNDYKACKAKDATYTVANMRYAPCRRVTIKLDTQSCQSSTGGDLGNIIRTVASDITQ